MQETPKMNDWEKKYPDFTKREKRLLWIWFALMAFMCVFVLVKILFFK